MPPALRGSRSTIMDFEKGSPEEGYETGSFRPAGLYGLTELG
jgi:hypothetical protein